MKKKVTYNRYETIWIIDREYSRECDCAEKAIIFLYNKYGRIVKKMNDSPVPRTGAGRSPILSQDNRHC